MNKFSKEEIEQQIINDFINKIEDTEPFVFFSFSDLLKINDISETLKTSFCIEDSPAYYDLPVKGFRYLYFGGLIGDIKPEPPMVNFEKLKSTLEKKGYIMTFDDAFLFVGIPEINFESSYEVNFNGVFEDSFI